MARFLLLMFPVFFVIQASAQPDLGMKMSSLRQYVTDSSTFLSVSRSEIKLCYKIVYKRIKFDVTLSKDRKVDYVSTSDRSFVTPDGIKITSKFSEIPNPANAKVLHDEKWWTKYFKMPSGWYAAFPSDRDINGDSRVIYLFKKKL